MIRYVLGYSSGHTVRLYFLSSGFKSRWGNIFLTSRWAPKVAFCLRFNLGRILEH